METESTAAFPARLGAPPKRAERKRVFFEVSVKFSMTAGRLIEEKDRRSVSSCRPISLLSRPQVKLLVGTIETRQGDPKCLDIDGGRDRHKHVRHGGYKTTTWTVILPLFKNVRMGGDHCWEEEEFGKARQGGAFSLLATIV
jgi:hypothetical protein